MRPLELSPWQRFREKYSSGCGSDLCKLANRVCLARGSVPCDLLFCAEGPGHSEDAKGSVLVGPAGKYFDDILKQSVPNGIAVGYCNLVGCIPLENEGTKKAGQPSVEEIDHCSRRLIDFIVLCNPKLLINVGVLSTDMMDRKSSRGYKMYWREIDRLLKRQIPCEWVLHPSFLMQQESYQQSILRRKTILTIRNSVNKYILGIKPEDDED